MSLVKSIEARKEYEDKLYTIIYKYQIKYIYYVFEKQYDDDKQINRLNSLYRHFQKRLLKIADWSSDKLHKEYKKFLEWCKRKYNIQEEELQQILNTIITLFVKIMINKKNIIIEGLLDSYTFPKFKYFFYKCLKRISRHYYENPKSLTIDDKNEILNSIYKTTILELIRSVVYNMLPMKQVMTILEYKDLINEDESDENKRLLVNNFVKEYGIKKLLKPNKIFEELKKNKTETVQKSKAIENKILNIKEKKNIIIYISILLFGLFYPIRLIYKLLKWSFLTIQTKD